MTRRLPVGNARMSSRLLDVLALVEWRRPLDESIEALSKFPWDYEGPPQEFRAAHVKGALGRYTRGEVTANEIENWANAIEMRDDLEFEAQNFTNLTELIFELANPVLTEALTKERAIALLQNLEKSDLTFEGK